MAAEAAPPGRPRVAREGPAAEDGAAAVVALVEELQAGWDERDADVSNRHVAADVVWGSPFGATVGGYDALHAIHTRLKREGTGGPESRFEIVSVLPLAEGLVVAQVRRAALGADGRPVAPTADLGPRFSELALYVLVRRHGTWWLAAGQNTPIRLPPGGDR